MVSPTQIFLDGLQPLSPIWICTPDLNNINKFFGWGGYGGMLINLY